MRNKQKELEKELQLIRDEVREWWWELDFERQMLRKEVQAKREQLEDKQKLLREEQNDYRWQKICWTISILKLLWNESAPTVHSDIQIPNQSQETLPPEMRPIMNNGYFKLGAIDLSY